MVAEKNKRVERAILSFKFPAGQQPELAIGHSLTPFLCLSTLKSTSENDTFLTSRSNPTRSISNPDCPGKTMAMLAVLPISKMSLL